MIYHFLSFFWIFDLEIGLNKLDKNFLVKIAVVNPRLCEKIGHRPFRQFFKARNCFSEILISLKGVKMKLRITETTRQRGS